jgi:signal transduction histidine kinase
MMPRLDGFGLVHQLRADQRTATTPVILLSARAGQEARIQGLQHGADDYLIKPFAARELLAHVATHLELGRMRRAVQDELRRGRDELERRVVERTAKLAEANKQLRAEMRERQQAEAARTDLLRKLATVQEDERRRVARDLHDSVGQLMAGLSLEVKAILASGPLQPSAAVRLEEVQQLVEALSQQVHDLAVRLRPTALDDLGLAVALYIVKRAAADDLVRAIRCVAAGEIYLDPAVAGPLVASQYVRARTSLFSHP